MPTYLIPYRSLTPNGLDQQSLSTTHTRLAQTIQRLRTNMYYAFCQTIQVKKVLTWDRVTTKSLNANYDSAISAQRADRNLPDSETRNVHFGNSPNFLNVFHIIFRVPIGYFFLDLIKFILNSKTQQHSLKKRDIDKKNCTHFVFAIEFQHNYDSLLAPPVVRESNIDEAE